MVDTFADLPDPADHLGEIYVVLTTTGIWPVRKSRGFWYSDGTAWAYLGDFTATYIADLYESNPDVNRFTDADVAKLSAAAAGEILIAMNCYAGDVVGGIVIPDTTMDSTVISISNNVYTGLIFGVIHDKPTATTCNVQVNGSRTDGIGLSRGMPVFVGTSGEPTTTPPITGDLQLIGLAFSSTRWIVDIAKSKVSQ